MPVVESSTTVPVSVEVAFAVAQTTGETRLRWDPFIRHQQFLDGATGPAKGVRTRTRHWSGLGMVSEYVSHRPPTTTGMAMVSGPWFFSRLAAGWRFSPVEDQESDGGEAVTRATWRYSFACRPTWLAPVAERLGSLLLARDIERRIAGFARGCADPVVVAAARASLEK